MCTRQASEGHTTRQITSSAVVFSSCFKESAPHALDWASSHNPIARVLAYSSVFADHPIETMSVQYVAASSASTSKGYVQVPQFQVMTVASSSAPTNTKTTTSGKRSSKNGKNNANNVHEVPQQQQHIQLVTMDQSAMMDNCGNQYVMQIPQNQIQMVSNSNVPMQFVSLPEGAAFVPMSSYNHQPSQPTVFQTSDGQQIQFVIAGDGMYNQSPVATVALNSAPIEEQNHKSGDDSISYVNPKQYARIFQRRGARAKMEMEGRITKQRRGYLHESRHKHAMNRIRGLGGKFDHNQDESAASSPSSSKANSNISMDSQTPIKDEASPPPAKRPA